jgi:hypothetical protein
VIVLHHVLADGLTGVAIARSLLDHSPDAYAGQPGPRVVPPLPDRRALIADNLRSRAASLWPTVRRIPRLPAWLRAAWRPLQDAAGDFRTRGSRHVRVPRRRVDLDPLEGPAQLPPQGLEPFTRATLVAAEAQPQHAQPVPGTRRHPREIRGVQADCDADAAIASAMAGDFGPWPSAAALDTSGPREDSLAAALAVLDPNSAEGEV